MCVPQINADIGALLSMLQILILKDAKIRIKECNRSNLERSENFYECVHVRIAQHES